MNRNKLNYRIGPLRSDSVIKLVSDLITESDQAVRAVHSCNSWFCDIKGCIKIPVLEVSKIHLPLSMF